MAELQGRVLKNYNGYYYLKVDGESEPYTCKVKGKMKKNRFSLATGDIACFEVSSSEKREGMITGVLPRRNFCRALRWLIWICLWQPLPVLRRTSAFCWQISCWRWQSWRKFLRFGAQQGG